MAEYSSIDGLLQSLLNSLTGTSSTSEAQMSTDDFLAAAWEEARVKKEQKEQKEEEKRIKEGTKQMLDAMELDRITKQLMLQRGK